MGFLILKIEVTQAKKICKKVGVEGKIFPNSFAVKRQIT